MEIVLASASPRRKELLEQIGLQFTVDPSDYPEDAFFEMKPAERARQVSLEKARSVATRHKDALVIAADSLIVLKDQVLGKPHDASEAKRMLKSLSGRAHTGITGFTVLDSKSGKSESRSVKTKVFMRKLSDKEIDAYVASGEPLDKAGAYGIQGVGAVLIDRIEGDYYNVVGLPLASLAEVLKKFGVEVLGQR